VGAVNVSSNPSCTNGANPPICHPHAIGDSYTAHMSLWTVTGEGECLPDAQILGSLCTRTTNDWGDNLYLHLHPGDFITCHSGAGLASGIVLPDGDDDPVTGQCGVDFFLEVFFTGGAADGVGFFIDNNPFPGLNQDIGGPALDDQFAESVIVFPNCNVNTGMWDGTWQFGSFGPGQNSDFRVTSVCTEPHGPCCDGAGGCELRTSAGCAAAGGSYLGDNELGSPNTCDSPDTDSDGTRDECDLCVSDPSKTAPGQCGCGKPETDSDDDATADCIDGCPDDSLKDAAGICGCGIADTDSDGDGTVNCQDGCPEDPNKVASGICGCGVAETGDSDLDGISDCNDQCPGVDDSVFALGCAAAIPTVSGWGIVIFALSLLTLAKVLGHAMCNENRLQIGAT